MIRQKVCDAIEVGSGMSGGWAAKELTERGLNTLVLEAGRELTVLARNALGERVVSSPAVSGGRLFIRTDASLSAVAGRAESITPVPVPPLIQSVLPHGAPPCHCRRDPTNMTPSLYEPGF